jgi:Coenzyme PQQ synthesis protein D (PqqD)
MDYTQKFERNENIVYREEDDGAFLFNPGTGNLKYMNRSGRKAFLLLTGQQDLNQVINHMLGLYPDVNRRLIEKDMETFLKELEENGFLFPLDRK